METWSTRSLVRLLCAAFLLLVDSAAHARMLAEDVWGEEEMMEEVFHTRRQLQGAPYCVAVAGADETKLQDALDWACGPATNGNGGGVDCSGILQTGACYTPNNLEAHCSYAFNLYYVSQSGAANSCDFGGLAMTTSTDPSIGSCIYTALGSSGSSPSTSNSSSTPFTSSPPSSSNFTTTTGSTSNAMTFTLSWVHTWCSLIIVLLLASRL